MIRRIIAAAIIAGATISSALAMTASSVPPKFSIPWGQSAGSSYIRSIPTASQIGIQNGAASLTDGFPPLTFLPVGAGGVPPFGQDFNGILKQITQWSLWQATGTPIGYDADFSSSIGGYPQGAILAVAGTPGAYWFSEIDNNTSDPDTGGSNWAQFSPLGAQTRDISVSGPFTINPTDGTIGVSATAASSATLPTGVPNGKTIEIQDLASNFNIYPVTISAPGGETIAGQNSVTLYIDGQDAKFTYHSSLNVWSFNQPSIPTGNIQIAAGGTADPGFMLAYGEAVSRTTYAALFAKIGTAYGSGDGSTTFNVPDLRGAIPAGKDNMGGTAANRITSAVSGVSGTTLGAAGGSQGYASGIAQTYLKSFSLSVTNTLSQQFPDNIGATAGSGTGLGGIWDGNPVSGGLYGGISVSSGGLGTAFPTLPYVQIVAYEIKY